MSQQLTLEISDELYLRLQHQADITKQSVSELLTNQINQRYGMVSTPSLSSAVEQEARQRLLNYAGIIDLGYATGIDNESIDADLAKVYANEF
jgi:predicted transcriptional regulator